MLNSQSKNRKLTAQLLDWFAANARDLPWRRTRDPYAIWVSEIMLQQTQVKTVIPYWERWMRELPTIESLARARADKIHKLWEGLGYYTRVRNLQKAAQQIISHPAGKFPRQFEEVLALPGIGRYTAGAICSIAFNQPTPILDGNVIRVLTRIHGITADPREKQTNARLWQLAEELVTCAKTAQHAKTDSPKTPPADTCCSHLNQSLMELGALICTPRTPNCVACPVQKLCGAHKAKLQDQLPNLGKRAAATERCFQAYIIERAGKFLVRQRPGGVVNAHLWEFPNVEVAVNKRRARDCESPTAVPARTYSPGPDTPYQPGDFRITSPAPLCVIKHSITRYRITLEVWRAELSDGWSERQPRFPGEWLALPRLHELAFTSAHKQVLVRLQRERGERGAS